MPAWSALDTVLAQARAAEQAGSVTQAATLLDAHAGAFSGSSGLWNYARGTLAFRMGQADAALACFEAAVKLEPEVAEYRANLGAALLDQSRRTGSTVPLERARRELEEALRWGPTLTTTRVNLGLCLLHQALPAEALAQFDQALATDPGDVAAMFNRAAALKQLGRSAESLAMLDQVLSQKPGFDLALQAKARLAGR